MRKTIYEKRTSLMLVALMVALMLPLVSAVKATYTESDAIQGYVYWCECWTPKSGLTVHVYRVSTGILEGYKYEEYGNPVWLGTDITDGDGKFHIAYLYAHGEQYRVEVETEYGTLVQTVAVSCGQTVQVQFHYCPPRHEGLTPGWWKNQAIRLNFWEPTGYAPEDQIQSVFTVPSQLSELSDDTLLEALAYGGGKNTIGGARILLRAAVAAILNAAHPDIDYPWTVASVISAVNNALASLNRDAMVTLAGQLDAFNNLGAD